MSLKDDEYVHIRSLIASIHRPKNVARPPEFTPPTAVVCESPGSSDTDRSGIEADQIKPRPRKGTGHVHRTKSNSISGTSLAPPGSGQQSRQWRQLSPLAMHVDCGESPAGPQSAGPHLMVPRFMVTAPPGEHHRRLSHAFHGFALRRHSNTVRDNYIELRLERLRSSCHCLQLALAA